ncbi:MAG: cupredoxin domain-containing protein [Gammaproteobacteria bacterium]
MKRKQAPKATSRKSAVLLSLAGLVVLGLAITLFLAPYVGSAKAGATLQISMSGWKPALIRAKSGQPISITMINMDNRFHTDGGGWHGFTVPAFGVDEQVGPKKTRTFTFTPTRPGNYVFYCEICCGGKENPFMRGELIVS